MKRIAAALAAIALLASCEDGIRRISVPEISGSVLTITSSASPEYAVPESFSVYNDVDTTSVAVPFGKQFNIALEKEVHSLVALSPARVSDKGATSQTLTISAIQNPPSIGFIDPDSYPMYASSEVVDLKASFELVPVAGALALNLRGLVDETLDSLVLTPVSNINFCGSITADLTSGPKFKTGDCSDPIKVRFAKGVDVSEGAVYVSLARQNYPEISVIVYTSKGMYKFVLESVTLSGVDCYTTGFDLTTGEFIPGSSNGNIEDPSTDPDNGNSPEITEDLIPDFSRVGYMWGDRDIPAVPVIAELEAPEGDEDATSLINNAIAGATGPGAILLKAGTYRVSSKISINRSGIVLRGEGEGKTIIKGTGIQQISIISIGSGSVSYGAFATITEKHVPVGRLYVKVDNPGMFSVGERVAIYRPATTGWISAIKMDQIPMAADESTSQWKPSNFEMYWERVVTRIEGDRVYFENPVVMAIDDIYGGGKLYKVVSNRVINCGIENLTIDSEFDPSLTDVSSGLTVYVDENHAWNAVTFGTAEHCWARKVTAIHYGCYGFVLTTNSKNITVENCTCEEPVSIVTGSRRYGFCFNKAQLSLVKGCTCDRDRHQFVSGAAVCGPNAFVECTSTNSLAEAGPHQRWATGILYDCVKASGWLTVQDRDNWGTGHGWAGANFVLWNCEAAYIVCQSPWVSAKNYAVGCIGEKVATQKSDAAGRPDGEWASHGSHVTSGTYFGATADGLSLYKAQKAARQGDACPSSCYQL